MIAVDKEMEEKLTQGLTALIESMDQLQERCYQILGQIYSAQEKIQFPVDVIKIAEYLGVKVWRAPLNYGRGKRIDQNIAQLRLEIKNESVVKKIILDDEIEEEVYGVEELSDLERYAVAFELSKFIIDKNEYGDLKADKKKISILNLTSVPYSLPRLAAQLETFEYEMCAIFLLLPLRTFLDEFYQYVVEIEEQPVLMDRWIRHLSIRAEIPNYQLVNGYQYIKYCAYKYYDKYLAEISEGLSGEEKEKLRKLRELFQ